MAPLHTKSCNLSLSLSLALLLNDVCLVWRFSKRRDETSAGPPYSMAWKESIDSSEDTDCQAVLRLGVRHFVIIRSIYTKTKTIERSKRQFPYLEVISTHDACITMRTKRTHLKMRNKNGNDFDRQEGQGLCTQKDVTLAGSTTGAR
ncbi:hypothetical protein B0T17DRAFT_539076 [Bombardia bombarda]|uniref:Secreted protein n=1 Tax=Bombardia bombarda TaxID=252184 RepID=A0AA39WHZ9_9PEZI|nr:hypothetical protein B0T17DRAFT_539076 [Bombardia bombarda]